MKKFIFFSLLFLGLNFSMGEKPSPNVGDKVKTAKISWYGGRFHGRLTASGVPFNMNALTAAHKKLPFGTKVKITNKKNGKTVTVTINDRGPYVGNRKFDLSKAAFHKIAKGVEGVITVSYKIIK